MLTFKLNIGNSLGASNKLTKLTEIYLNNTITK